MDYYLALNRLIEMSQRRISMSALYLGTGKLEQFMMSKLDRQLEAKSQLRVSMLLDYMRGTRVNRDGKSSR